MLFEDVSSYMMEVHRVLRHGGRSLTTWFVLDDEARRRIAAGSAGPLRRFQHPLGRSWVVNPKNPEAAVGYEELTIRELYRASRLTLREPILLGSWSGSGRSDNPHGQDIILADRVEVER